MKVFHRKHSKMCCAVVSTNNSIWRNFYIILLILLKNIRNIIAIFILISVYILEKIS